MLPTTSTWAVGPRSLSLATRALTTNPKRGNSRASLLLRGKCQVAAQLQLRTEAASRSVPHLACNKPRRHRVNIAEGFSSKALALAYSSSSRQNLRLPSHGSKGTRASSTIMERLVSACHRVFQVVGTLRSDPISHGPK